MRFNRLILFNHLELGVYLKASTVITFHVRHNE